MKKLKRPILAEGEKTGHVHELIGEEAEVFLEDDATRTFTLKCPAVILHAEHASQPVRIGIPMRSDTVVEIDPFEGERKVQD